MFLLQKRDLHWIRNLLGNSKCKISGDFGVHESSIQNILRLAIEIKEIYWLFVICKHL